MGECHRKLGARRTAEIADAMKRLGFSFATKSGMSVAVADVEIPAQEGQMLADGRCRSRADRARYRRGLITEQRALRAGDRDLEPRPRTTLTDELEKILDPYGLVYTLANSGATKARFKQIRQLAGMRGLMADPSGRIIDLPIRSNFREGLTVLEYFVSTHGGRKGLADTALRTADAGYLTRRLVDVAQDVMINMEDCGTLAGNWVRGPANRDVARLAGRLAWSADSPPSRSPTRYGRIHADMGEEITEGSCRT